ncbi:MAG: hypothetical protein ABIS36_23300 [Chryseolinea sp.]
MKYSIIRLIFLFGGFSCLRIAVGSDKQSVVDSLFVTWNKASIQSLKRQIRDTGDSEHRYADELSAFKELLGIYSEKSINNNSIRYKFLTKIKATERSLDFFILESNRSGETIEIVNYVAYYEGTLVKKLFRYRYSNNRWILDIEKQIELEYERDFLRSMKKYGEGNNQENVIITKFSKGKVEMSEFFTPYTLSKQNSFSNLLNLEK